MTNSKWVTMHILWKAVSLHLFLLPTASEWHCTFCERQSYYIFFHDQQEVSDIPHFVKESIIISSPMTQRKWVTLHIFVKSSLITSLPMTNRKWVCCERQYHHIISYDPQLVGDIAHFLKCGLITSAPMTHCSLWVALDIFDSQCHHISAYDQQAVCDNAHHM